MSEKSLQFDSISSEKVFFGYIKDRLPDSRTIERQEWAKKVIGEKWSIMDFSELLFEDRKIALPFSWFLSDIGHLQKGKLLDVLPEFFTLRSHVKSFDFELSFASYWLICGIPEDNKGNAIDLLFSWLRSNETNGTTKSRTLAILYNLSEEHKELKQELILHLQEQPQEAVNSFTRKSMSMLEKLTTQVKGKL